jgi:hypothetical protein
MGWVEPGKKGSRSSSSLTICAMLGRTLTSCKIK